MRAAPGYCPTWVCGSRFLPVQPLIDRPFCRRRVGQGHLMSQAGRSITRIDSSQYNFAVLPRDQRGFQASYGASEVTHLLGKAIIPEFLKDRPAPTFGCGRLLDCVAEA